MGSGDGGEGESERGLGCDGHLRGRGARDSSLHPWAAGWGKRECERKGTGLGLPYCRRWTE